MRLDMISSSVGRAYDGFFARASLSFNLANKRKSRGSRLTRVHQPGVINDPADTIRPTPSHGSGIKRRARSAVAVANE
jgi:hypothetical protein